MKKEAELHASEDKLLRELVDLKNQSEQVIYSTTRSLEEYGEKVSSEVRSNIESAIANLEDKVKGDDAPAISAAMQQVNDASIELGKAVYESTASGGAAGGASGGAAGARAGDHEDGGSGGGDDNVIDAEYEVKDDK